MTVSVDTAVDLSDRTTLENLITEKVKAELGALQFVSPQQMSQMSMKMGQPSTEQLAKINSYTGNDSDPADWFVFWCRASDNFVNRSGRKWHMSILQQMASDYPGQSLLFDHEWESSEDAIGFIFDSQLVVTPNAPNDCIQSPGRTALNQQILADEGYACVYTACCVKADQMQAVVQGIQDNRLNDVSTGGLLSGIKTICPNCSKALGRDVTFNERNGKGYTCPHLIPSMWSALFYDDDMDEDEVGYADYLILDGIHDTIELSLVNSGNLPAASVMR